MATKNFKVALIGAGPGGVSCALGLLEARIAAVLIDKNLNCGGQLKQIPSPILNFAGTTWSNGNAAQKSLEQSLIQASHEALNDDCDLEYLSNTTVAAIDHNGRVYLDKGNAVIEAEYIVLAPGYRTREIFFAGSETALGHVYYHLSKAQITGLNTKVALIVGGGDSALLEALSLQNQCKSVYLMPRSGLSKARPDLQKRIRDGNINVLYQSEIIELEDGQDGLSSVAILDKNTGKKYSLPCNFVVVKAGYQPNTEFLQGTIDLSESQHIKVNAQLNVFGNGQVLPNIFAIGDAVASKYEVARIARSVGQGMQVASTISRLLSERK